MNASECCSRLNKVVIPELVMVSTLCISFIMVRCFGVLSYILPMLCWLVYRILSKPVNHMSYYDPTEIHNHQQLKGYVKESLVKLAYHLIGFFIFLYSMISTIVDEQHVVDTRPIDPSMT